MIFRDKKGREVRVTRDPAYNKFFFFEDGGTVRIVSDNDMNTFINDCDLEGFVMEIICEHYYNYITYPTNNKFKEVRWYLW